MKIASWQSVFQSPPVQYRGKPLWAWNGKLEPEELRRQIRLLQQMGFGGFFMHSRVGLKTSYLSADWFKCVRICVAEAKKLGLEAWIYDEDRWPSGSAGGLVTKNPKYGLHWLLVREIGQARKFRWRLDILAAFTGRVSGHRLRNFRPLPRNVRPVLSPGEVILEFAVQPEPPSDWYNGNSPVDTMNPEAVRRFIAITYEAYRRNVGQEFGKVIPGVFTDEPNHGSVLVPLPWAKTYGTPWTAKLPAVFRKRYGYDLLTRLPELFFDVNGQAVSQARYHYHDCMTHLYVDSFARQVGNWCERNGVMMTGHVAEENTLSTQVATNGDCMRFYEHMEAPGMDVLTDRWRIWDAAKQVSSVAHQFGRRWRLTESYGCTGWDFPLAGHKALGDWQVALGINLRCQHHSWYTMEGETKRDYPGSIFYQSPWWTLYPKVEDYFARLHVLMSRGTEVRDLLVIHPVESMWLLFRKGWDGWDGFGKIDKNSAVRIAAFDRVLVDLRDTLLAAHLDFDYGDEELLSRHGKVTAANDQPRLHLAKASYRAVIVPPMLTLRRTTLELLRKFQAIGGTVVFADTVASCVDALPCDEVTMFARKCRRAPAKGAVLVRVVEPIIRRVSITDGRGREITAALYLLREDTDAFYLFVCNTGYDYLHAEKLGTIEDIPVRDRTLEFHEVRIQGFIGCKGAPIELDPHTGRKFAAAATARTGGWEIRTSLPRLGSRLFVVPKKAGGLKLLPRPSWRTVRSRSLGNRSWPVTLSETNNLVLDRPRFKIGDGAWQEADEILRVDRAVRDALGIPLRGGAMKQPWARKKSSQPKSIRVQLEYEFQVKTLCSGEVFLAAERAALFKMAMNDVPLDPNLECGWWTDPSLRKVPFSSSILRTGRNTVTLACDYDENYAGLEIIFVLGCFGVNVKGTKVTMVEAPTNLRLGDWVSQGLPFYSGTVTYQTVLRAPLRKGESLFVQVPEYCGSAVRIMVDGREAGVIGWEPNEADITDFARPGATLQIEVLSHRRNSHGPLHFFEKQPGWTGPNQFVTKDKQWIDGYQLVPCGLMKPPRLAVRRPRGD